jgi:hypothetical protein
VNVDKSCIFDIDDEPSPALRLTPYHMSASSRCSPLLCCCCPRVELDPRVGPCNSRKPCMVSSSTMSRPSILRQSYTQTVRRGEERLTDSRRTARGESPGPLRREETVTPARLSAPFVVVRVRPKPYVPAPDLHASRLPRWPFGLIGECRCIVTEWDTKEGAVLAQKCVERKTPKRHDAPGR